MAGLARRLLLSSSILLLLLVSTTPAVRSVPAPADNVQTACNNTQIPQLCLKTLSANPDSRTASMHRLAELCLLAASKMSMEAAAFAKTKMDAVKEPSLCLKSCADDINTFAKNMAGLPSQITAAMFDDMKLFLFRTLVSTAGPWECGGHCEKKHSFDEIAMREKTADLWRLMLVTNDLVRAVSPGPGEEGPDPAGLGLHRATVS